MISWLNWPSMFRLSTQNLQVKTCYKFWVLMFPSCVFPNRIPRYDCHCPICLWLPRSGLPRGLYISMFDSTSQQYQEWEPQNSWSIPPVIWITNDKAIPLRNPSTEVDVMIDFVDFVAVDGGGFLYLFSELVVHNLGFFRFMLSLTSRVAWLSFWSISWQK